jgi:hypothetical protein
VSRLQRITQFVATIAAEMSEKPRLRIAIFAETDWAFGRIGRDLMSHSRHDISIVPWSTLHPPDVFDSYDLVYTPEYNGKLPFIRYVRHVLQCKSLLTTAVAILQKS